MKIKNTFLALCLITSVGVSLSPQDVLSIKPKMFLNDKKELITPPTTYNYAFVPNDSGYLHEEAVDSYYFMSNSAYSEPIFTRTYDGAYYDYTYTGSDGVMPFPITMTFNNSNSLWKSESGGYKPYYQVGGDAQRIGSDSNTGTSSKVHLTFNNNTNKNYFLNLDFGGSNADNYVFYKIDNNTISTNYGTLQIATSVLNNFYIPSYSSVLLYQLGSTKTFYLCSLYLRDLGIDTSYTNGYNDGSGDGQSSFDIASSQWVIDNSNAFDSGYIQGGETMTDIFSLFTSAISTIGDVLSISLFGAFTIGGLVSIPLVMGLLFWIIEKWRGR